MSAVFVDSQAPGLMPGGSQEVARDSSGSGPTEEARDD